MPQSSSKDVEILSLADGLVSIGAATTVQRVWLEFKGGQREQFPGTIWIGRHAGDPLL